MGPHSVQWITENVYTTELQHGFCPTKMASPPQGKMKALQLNQVSIFHQLAPVQQEIILPYTNSIRKDVFRQVWWPRCTHTRADLPTLAQVFVVIVTSPIHPLSMAHVCNASQMNSAGHSGVSIDYRHDHQLLVHQGYFRSQIQLDKQKCQL